MNTAGHAEAILEAWMFADQCRLEAALKNASISASHAHSDSRLEEERKELLKTIIEELNALTHEGALPKYSQVRGAVSLLRHLSSTLEENRIQAEFRAFNANTLKFISAKDEMIFRSRMRPQG
jgi:hypothetical protein